MEDERGLEQRLREAFRRKEFGLALEVIREIRDLDLDLVFEVKNQEDVKDIKRSLSQNIKLKLIEFGYDSSLVKSLPELFDIETALNLLHNPNQNN
jgi:hypothetical protein